MQPFTVSTDDHLELGGIPMNGRALLGALRDYLTDWPAEARSAYSLGLLGAIATWAAGLAALRDGTFTSDEPAQLVRATLQIFAAPSALVPVA